MASESRAWTWFQNGVRSLPELDIQRVESKCRSGVPDVEGCWSGGTFWIEFKACDRPERETIKLEFKISTEQIVWLKRRWRCGGNAFLLVRVGVGNAVRVYLIRGCDMSAELSRCTEDKLKELTIMRKEIPTPKLILHTVIFDRNPIE